jgi:hypothetical protein
MVTCDFSCKGDTRTEYEKLLDFSVALKPCCVMEFSEAASLTLIVKGSTSYSVIWPEISPWP